VISYVYNCDDVDTNECDKEDSGGCSDLAICINTQGSFYCVCRDGYTGNGFNCTGK